MIPPACPTAFEPRSGTFHGLRTVGLQAAGAWFEALADAGPRIVRLGFADGPNLLAETPDIAWPTADGPYRLWGGHRLWLAPEDAGRNTSPDTGGLVITPLPDGLRLTGAPDPETSCVRVIEVRLDAHLPRLRVRHEVANHGTQAIEAALWAITQLPADGMAILPQAPFVPGHATRPNRAVILWPYASWEDERLVVRDGLLAVHGVGGPEFKAGCLDIEGWAAWVGDGSALVRRWAPDREARYPDLGSSAEVFVTERYTELEVLGALTVLGPGECTALDETWELRRDCPDDLERLRELLAEPLGASPRQPIHQHEA